MANCCGFALELSGFKSESDKEEALNIFQDNDKRAGGRDKSVPYMAIDDIVIQKENDTFFLIEGYCNWSLKTSMTKDGYYSRASEYSAYTCIEEICKKYSVCAEAYSREAGMCFEEHLLCDKDGNLSIEERDYEEVCLLDSYEDFLDIYSERARQKVGIFTREDWQSAYDDDRLCFPFGGFEEWVFDCNAVA